MAVDFDDTEYTWPPGQLVACSGTYDLRTNAQRMDARMQDYQQRIAQLEQRLRHVEFLLHRIANDAVTSTDSM